MTDPLIPLAVVRFGLAFQELVVQLQNGVEAHRYFLKGLFLATESKEE
jgi:hypothetical protein